MVGMREKGATIILIAQRAGIMVQVDKMLVLQAGTITGFGPRDEVLGKLRRPAPQAPPRAVSGQAGTPQLQRPT